MKKVFLLPIMALTLLSGCSSDNKWVDLGTGSITIYLGSGATTYSNNKTYGYYNVKYKVDNNTPYTDIYVRYNLNADDGVLKTYRYAGTNVSFIIKL